MEALLIKVLQLDEDSIKEQEEIAKEYNTEHLILLAKLYKRYSDMVRRSSVIDPEFSQREKENIEQLKIFQLYVEDD